MKVLGLVGSKRKRGNMVGAGERLAKTLLLREKIRNEKRKLQTKIESSFAAFALMSYARS